MNTIQGTEMEWSALWRGLNDDGDAVPVPKMELQRHLAAYIKTVPNIGGGGSSTFIANGSRLYVDVDHLETTTPEDTSIEGTVASELANEQIATAVLQRNVLVNPRTGTETRLGWFALNNRVVDDEGTSWGYHESYLTPSENVRTGAGSGMESELDASKLKLLGVHMATRGIYAGAGLLKTDGSFHIAQKAACSRNDYSESTGQYGKAIVNLRDEPLGDFRYARIHVTSGDPTMSPWSKRMALGTTRLVVALGAHDIDVPGLEFADTLVRVSRVVAADVRAKAPLLLKTRDTSSAIAAQRCLLEAAQQLPDADLTEEDRWTLAEWERALAVLEQDPLLLADRADWPMKYKILARHHDKTGHAWESEEMRSQERRWDEIGPNGIALVLRKKLWLPWMPPEELIEDRVTQPPKTTRAFIRGKFIQQFSRRARASASWNLLTFDGEFIGTHDPFQTHNPRLAAIMLGAEKIAS